MRNRLMHAGFAMMLATQAAGARSIWIPMSTNPQNQGSELRGGTMMEINQDIGTNVAWLPWAIARTPVYNAARGAVVGLRETSQWSGTALDFNSLDALANHAGYSIDDAECRGT